MPSRYFCPQPIDFSTDSPCVVRLEGPESHHITTVMRLVERDRLTLFDGSGAEFDAEVLALQKRGPTKLLIHSRVDVDREPAVTLTLGVALPKGDRQKVLVEMLTQLGVSRLVPLATEHSVAAPKGSGLDKLRRGVIEASKQCGRNRLMAINEPVDLDAFLTTTQADVRLIAHPTGNGSLKTEQGAKSVAIAIGPEGGFADAEVAKAAALGWESVSFGKSILRIETAAIAAAALFTTAGN